MSEKRPDESNQMVENAETTAEQSEPKTGFMLRVETMSEREWDKWSKVVGVVLGIAAAASLFFYPSSENSFLPMGALIALGLAMILPGYAERRLERRAPKMRIALIITLVIAMAVYLGVMLLTDGGAAL